MILLDLFLGFFKVGCFSFGGAYAAIPLIRDIVLSYGWIDDEMLSYMIAVSECTPGPIMVNMATFIGTAQAGIAGAGIATFAVVLPSFVIILLITALLGKILKNPYVQAVLRGMKPCMAGIILATGCRMIFRNLFSDPFASPDGKAILLTVVLAAIYYGAGKCIKKKVSPVMLIAISAVLGGICFRL